MNSALAILTYNRLPALSTLFQSLHAARILGTYPVAVFEDAGVRDGTRAWLGRLGKNNVVRDRDDELEADVIRYMVPRGFPVEIFLGERNLGVAGNSNRALRWFERMERDHLLLCNDDITFAGDALQEYGDAHAQTGLELLCFNDFPAPQFKGITVPVNQLPVRIFQQMTGMVMSVTRDLTNRLGYYDTSFGRFGNEHCSYNNRARAAGFIDVDGQPQTCVDIVSKTLVSQAIPSSLTAEEKLEAHLVSDVRIKNDYLKMVTGLYVPFSLRHLSHADAHGGFGVPINPNLSTHACVVTDIADDALQAP
jgi:hypothetical protein